MDLTDKEKKAQERKRLNDGIIRQYGLKGVRGRAENQPPPPPKHPPRLRSKVEAQKEAHKRWTRIGPYSEYPYEYAPGTLLVFAWVKTRELKDEDLLI